MFMLSSNTFSKLSLSLWYFFLSLSVFSKIGVNGSKKTEFLEVNNTDVEAVHFQPIINAMEQVVLNGTARSAQIDSISLCGKTGTVENKSFMLY